MWHSKNCHHQIAFCKLNLKIEYSPPYECLAWDYKKAEANSNRKSLKQVNCEFLFHNKNGHEPVLIWNNTLLNVFLNYVPIKVVVFNENVISEVSDLIFDRKTPKPAQKHTG